MAAVLLFWRPIGLNPLGRPYKIYTTSYSLLLLHYTYMKFLRFFKISAQKMFMKVYVSSIFKEEKKFRRTRVRIEPGVQCLYHYADEEFLASTGLI